MAPRRRNPNSPRWAVRKDKPKPPRRRTLTDEDMSKLAELFHEKYGWTPRTVQLAGIRAQLEGVDTIVQAATGAGKTAIAAGVHLWPDNEQKVTIIVSPLLALEDEMVQTFKEQFNLEAIAVSSEHGSCSPQVVKDILSLKYQIILASPEMLQSRTFVSRILRNQNFARHVVSLFVDEAHCISHWGADFRKKYASLGVIRAFLPRGTPVIAVTATLTARVRRDIQSKLHFSKGESRFINFGNDRPNVSIVVRAAEHALNSYKDLDFVLPPGVSQAGEIPKTWIYVDNINTGTEIVDYLSNELEKRTRENPQASLPASLVRPFNATLSSEYRTAAMAAFREGTIRIMICTEAAGMGCDIPDIDVVVQWKLPATFSNFIQRAGRVARGRGHEGLAVLIVERSAYSIELTSPEHDTPNTSTAGKGKGKTATQTRGRKRKTASQTKASKEYAESHGVDRGGSSRKDVAPNGTQPHFDPDALDEGLRVFVQSTACRRLVWAEAFESPVSAPTALCCDICQPVLLDRTRPRSRTSETSPKPKLTRGVPDVKAMLALYEWRDEVYERDHSNAQYDSTAILDDTVIEGLCSVGALTQEKLIALLKPTWIWWDQHSNELHRQVEALDITYKAKPKQTKAAPGNRQTDPVS